MSSFGASYGSLLRSATLPRLLHACMKGMLGTLDTCAHTILLHDKYSLTNIITSGCNGLV